MNPGTGAPGRFAPFGSEPRAADAGAPARPGVRLRLLAERDRDLYVALWTCADVMDAVGPPLAAAQADAQFVRTVRHNRVATPGHRTWAIDAADTAEPLGLVALLRHGANAEFGVMLLPTARRRGAAAAAIALLLPHAFGRMGIERIDASRPNDAHVTVIERLFAPFGFARVRGLRPGEVGWQLSCDAWRRHAASA